MFDCINLIFLCSVLKMNAAVYILFIVCPSLAEGKVLAMFMIILFLSVCGTRN